MVRHFDHVTIAVADVDAAIAFFALLGFDCDKRVVIEGEVFAQYMGVPGIVSEHVTLVLRDAKPRMEVQLLGYRQPPLDADPMAGRLDRLGFNHICFDVADLDAEVARLTAAGVQLRNEVLRFHGRKLVFLRGPGEVVVELSERSADVP